MTLAQRAAEGEVLVQVLRCQHCPALAVCIADEHGGTRLTNHKCAGAWTTILSESVDPNLIRSAIRDNRRPRARRRLSAPEK